MPGKQRPGPRVGSGGFGQQTAADRLKSGPIPPPPPAAPVQAPEPRQEPQATAAEIPPQAPPEPPVSEPLAPRTAEKQQEAEPEAKSVSGKEPADPAGSEQVQGHRTEEVAKPEWTAPNEAAWAPAFGTQGKQVNASLEERLAGLHLPDEVPPSEVVFPRTVNIAWDVARWAVKLRDSRKDHGAATNADVLLDALEAMMEQLPLLVLECRTIAGPRSREDTVLQRGVRRRVNVAIRKTKHTVYLSNDQVNDLDRIVNAVNNILEPKGHNATSRSEVAEAALRGLRKSLEAQQPKRRPASAREDRPAQETPAA